MKVKKSLAGLALVAATAFAGVTGAAAEENHHYRHVLLISVDGMHAIDLENCSKGLSSIKGGSPYCPTLAGTAAARGEVHSSVHVEALGLIPGPDRASDRCDAQIDRRVL